MQILVLCLRRLLSWCLQSGTTRDADMKAANAGVGGEASCASVNEKHSSWEACMRQLSSFLEWSRVMNGSEVCGSLLSYRFEREQECAPLRRATQLSFTQSCSSPPPHCIASISSTSLCICNVQIRSFGISWCCELSKRPFTYSIMLLLNESHNKKLKRIISTAFSYSTILSVHTNMLLYCSQWFSNFI